MKKILIWGDSPTVPTGFSNVINYIISNLPKDQYEFVVLGINYNGFPHDFPFKIYPAVAGGDMFGIGIVNEVIAKENPDIILIVSDIWVINNMLKNIVTTAKIVAYFPVDAEDHDSEWYKCLDKTSKAVVYNEFGLSVAKKARKDIEYSIIGHGVDNSIFYKTHETRREAKRQLFNDPVLHDSFIILNAGRNQPRKRLDITMRAFKEFSKNKSNVFLYMHSGIIDSHIDTLRLAKELRIYDNLICTSHTEGPQKIHQDDLNLLYNACDVGINTGLGEGFGLPNAEHAATGAPQIVPEHSALIDLYKDCGILVPANILFTIDQISTTGKLVTIQAVAKAMNEIYMNKHKYDRLSKLSHSKFNSEEYSWKYIVQQWHKLFSEL